MEDSWAYFYDSDEEFMIFESYEVDEDGNEILSYLYYDFDGYPRFIETTDADTGDVLILEIEYKEYSDPDEDDFEIDGCEDEDEDEDDYSISLSLSVTLASIIAMVIY